MASPGKSLRAPLLWLLLPAMAGIALAPGHATDPIRPTTLLVAGLAFGAGAVLLAARDGPVRSAFSLILTAVAAGIAAFVYHGLRLPPLALPDGPPREATMTLVVDQVFGPRPTATSFGGLGRIVAADPPVAAAVGQRVQFSAIRRISLEPVRTGVYVMRGVLAVRAAGGDDFDRFLERRGVTVTLRRAQILREARPPSWLATASRDCARKFERGLRQGVERHPDAVALYLAMLLGEHAAMSADQQEAFVASGTYHVFVIAGLHVGIMALAIRSVLQFLRLPPAPTTLASLVLLGLYVEIAGAGLPARRAFVMIAFLHLARLVRRPANSLAALGLAAFVTLALDPQQLFDPGFQLSYAVVTALVVMGAPLGRRWAAAWHPWRDLPPASRGWWRQAVISLGRNALQMAAISSVALLASTPAMIGSFGVVSAGSVLANLLIVPLAFTAISAGFSSIVCTLAGWGAGSSLFNHAAILVIVVMQHAVLAAARVPGLHFPAQFRWPGLAPWGTALVVATMLAGAALRWRRAAGGFWPPAGVIAVLLIFGVKFGGNAAKVVPMKSAYELAMERLAKAEPAEAPLTAAQKGQLQEIDRLYQGKIAEREIFLKQQLETELAAQKFDEADKVRQQIVREKARLETERDEAKDKVRRGGR